VGQGARSNSIRAGKTRVRGAPAIHEHSGRSSVKPGTSFAHSLQIKRSIQARDAQSFNAPSAADGLSMASPRRIDVHFHHVPPFYREAVYGAGRGPAIGRYPDWTPEIALEVMDANGIEVALTSLAQPGVGFGTQRSAETLARRCNDYAAELRARWPARFGAFATVPMWTMDRAREEVAYALDTLGFDGVSLFASYGEKFLGDGEFDPLLQTLHERGAAVFVHPGLHPSSKGLALPWPAFMMEYLFDTTRAVVNLVFSGAIARFSRIRFILPHAGGLVPYFAWRLAVSPMIDVRLPQLSRDEILSGLAHFWYDNALSPGEQTFGALDHVARPERIVFGSDFPFANARVIAEAVKTHESGFLPEVRRAAIDRENALALFPKYAR
jgi:predicted TIM-barrel fold metal-dependent hydrolase